MDPPPPVSKKNPPLQQSMSPSSIKTQYETKGGFFLVRVACSYRMCYEDRLSPQGILTLSQARILVKPVFFVFWFNDTLQVKKCLPEPPPLLHMWGTTCMPNSSNVMRTAPLAEALAHFVLRVAVVCAIRTGLAQYTPGRQGNFTLSQARILVKPVCFFFFCFFVFFSRFLVVFFFNQKTDGLL